MKLLLMLACLLGLPAATFAQAAIAGSVRDPSGAVLPGVAVQASSPALIERTRATVTDANGRYRIQDLRPGTYAVKFTLAGWRPYLYEGLELVGSLTATVDAELALGGVTETVTVRSAIPVVDVYNAKRDVTLTADIVKSIPSAPGLHHTLL